MPEYIDHIMRRIERHYHPIWEASDRSRAFEFCNRIRRQDGISEYSKEKFDEGYQYRTIFHGDYKIAKEEFLNLVFGWW